MYVYTHTIYIYIYIYIYMSLSGVQVLQEDAQGRQAAVLRNLSINK